MRTTRRTRLCFAALMFSALSLAACGSGTPAPTPPAPLTTAEETTNNSESQWVVRQESQAKVAIVFVHGLFGDPIGTWTNANGTRFFDLVAKDPIADGKVDILAFGYPSNFFASGSFDIQAAAKALHARLIHHGILGYSKVVFVGHSMGGLVIMRELLMNRAVMPSVPVIVLIATPQEGADVSRIADYIARNPALSQLKPADRNDLLKILNDDWHAWPARPKVKCAYENKKTRGIQIVDWASSTRFCDDGVEVAADHLEIVKPAAADQLAVIQVTNALKEYALNPKLDPKLETPDFQTEGDHAVYVLTQLNTKLPAQVVNAGGSALQYSLAEPSDRNALMLWPDRPQGLPPQGHDSLFVLLLTSYATKSEYEFKLRTDYGPDRTVVVRVPNLAALRAQQVQLLQNTGSALMQQLDAKETADRWLQAPAEDSEVPEAVIRTVHEQITRELPDWPDATRWVIAADMLNGLNWPALAGRALRQAERVAPTFVQQSSVQHLAAVTASQSGETKIFATTDTPSLVETSPQVTPDNWLAATPGTLDTARLAQQLVKVPALRFYGLSLQGDVQKAKGDVEGARTSYQEAAVIRPAPSITRRLQITGGWKTTAPTKPGSGAAAAAASTNTEVAATKVPTAAVVVQPATTPEASPSPTVGTDPKAVVVRPTPPVRKGIALEPTKLNPKVVIPPKKERP